MLQPRGDGPRLNVQFSVSQADFFSLAVNQESVSRAVELVGESPAKEFDQSLTQVDLPYTLRLDRRVSTEI